MTAQTPRSPELDLPLDPEEGGGPPIGQPWTLVVESEGWSADLEHASPLPRVGERVEYIAADGARRMYRVRDVVHTVQPSASFRPPVASEHTLPNSTVNDGDAFEPPPELRAGLPRVCVEPDAEPEA